MQETLFSNPLLEPILMDALTLIHAMGGCNSDEEEEYNAHLESAVPPLFRTVIKVLNEHLGDEISFSVVQSQIGVAGRITGEGLGSLVRHGSKLFKQ